MTDELSRAEIEALKKLVPLVDQIEREARYQQARNIVVRRWKALMISAAAIIAVVVGFFDNIKSMVMILFR